MDDFHSRHRALFEPTAIDDKRVLIVGCGSVGSVLAMLLARAGVRRFTLADPDVVSASNIARTTYVEADLGVAKVDALAGSLRAIRSAIEVDARTLDLGTLEDDELESEIGKADVVIATTDHPPTQSRLAALSYHAKPAVFAGVYAKGVGGEVLWTAPEETPCYACVLGSIRGANAPPRSGLAYGLTTGQLAAEPALGIDIFAVTVRAAKIAFALLLRGHETSFGDVLDPKRSVLFVGNSADWIWNEPFETVWARADRRDDCICRLAPGASTATLALDTGD
ncbi:MAG: HesA/MoeB/ThiF family protein [Polyangiales bacterium]